MKALIKFMFILMFLSLIENLHASGCTPDSYYYNIIQKKKWKLVQVQDGFVNIEFNRLNMSMNGKGKYFTIDLCEEYISGRAVQSEFKTPYIISGNSRGDFNITEIDKNTVSSETEYNGISEDRYYNYLNKVKRWWLYRDSILKKWKFYLIIENENKSEAILTYGY